MRNTRQAIHLAAIFVFSTHLASCGGGGSGSNTNTPLSVTAFSLQPTSTKTFRFDWSDVADASYYRLLEDPDGVSGFTQVGSDIPPGTERYDHVVPLFNRVNARYVLQSCNASGCTDSSTVHVSTNLSESVGYIKAGNTGSFDHFGTAIALSGDGNTLAVGALLEDSSSSGIDGAQTDNSMPSSGAVYVFSRGTNSWSQQGYIKASNPDSDDVFGVSIAIDADGNTLVVGAYGESSSDTGINGNQADNSAGYAGAAYVFKRTNGIWSQEAYLKASNTDTDDHFGASVDLSDDGNTLAVGAYGEASAATGVDGDATDNTAPYSGAVYVFSRGGGIWTQDAYIKSSNSEADDFFGISVSLSGNGQTLAVGATGERSATTGIDGDQSDNSIGHAGAVYVFLKNTATWSQQAYVKASNTDADDYFGISIALDHFGDTLAVGAYGEDSAAAGIGGSETDNNAPNSGAAYIFARNGSSWSQQAYIKASNTDAGDYFGISVSLSGDGNTLVTGAYFEESSATGIEADQTDNSLNSAGAVYLFSRAVDIWNQLSYVKASNTDAQDYFGYSVSISDAGDVVAVGAYGEDGGSNGIGGQQADNSTDSSGAAYLF